MNILNESSGPCRFNCRRTWMSTRSLGVGSVGPALGSGRRKEAVFCLLYHVRAVKIMITGLLEELYGGN